ncbi:MAG: hypothetical protein V4629_01575 [Pseudomonadota bacterium]
MSGLKNFKKNMVMLITVGMLSACAGEESKDIEIDFNDNADEWEYGFSDYPRPQENIFELSAEQTLLPASLATNQRGYKLSGNNRSDDLYMFVAKEFTGFLANTRYDVQFEITFGTNAPSNCVGVGGAPGESVYIKAGASSVQPLSIDDGNNEYLMNIDKGNQATGGSDAIVLGDFANGTDCEENDTSYRAKTLSSVADTFSAYTSDDGSLWIMFGVDSGFESTTTIYLMEGKFKAEKVE